MRRWYWQSFARPLRVAVDLRPSEPMQRYLWTRVRGVHVGTWFIGAIQGSPARRRTRVKADAVLAERQT